MRAESQRPVRRVIAGLTGLVLLAAGTACGSDDDATDVDATDVENVVGEVEGEVESAPTELADALRDNGLDTIAGIVEEVDVTALIDDETFTFFAPNDDAFTSLGADQTADLLTDPARVLDVLRNHTLAARVNADELRSMTAMSTQAGETLEVSSNGDTVTVGGVEVVATDIAVGGGVIHIVDGLLLVP